jgi:hypothetical protein
MDSTKYVVAKAGSFNNIECVFILDNNTAHDNLPFSDDRIVSAGFFTWEAGEDECGNTTLVVKTFGKSVSLGVSSRPEDVKLIEKAMNWWVE